MNLTTKDLKDLEDRGISPRQITSQIDSFKQGFPFLKIKESASTKHGIKILDEENVNHYINEWSNYTKENSRDIYKFVPASGAATRMFKDLFDYLDSGEDNEYIETFFNNIEKFAFYRDLNKFSLQQYSKTVADLIEEGARKNIINLILNKIGLNYSFLPKGLIEFHSYQDYTRTPVEEHFVEGYQYALSKNTDINIHFTISPEHKQLFSNLINRTVPIYNNIFKTEYSISLSEQNSQTDTIAVDEQNNPIRDDNNKLILRPAGHGALLQNLNKIDGDVIFIKNIDNVVLDKYKDIETKYKKVLAGYLVSIQSEIFNYLKILDTTQYNRDILNEILLFTENTLLISKENTKTLYDIDLAKYLKEKLNRPIRVCGMVKNEGEAGGGPFFIEEKDGSISLQILEDSQIDKKNDLYKKLQKESTHFNPVDIVCGVKNYKGERFNLLDYVDTNTGFISTKSYKGRVLKALELPGLWNGSMSNWNTIFIEVPLDTFNPVKSINDLLRKHHQ